MDPSCCGLTSCVGRGGGSTLCPKCWACSSSEAGTKCNGCSYENQFGTSIIHMEKNGQKASSTLSLQGRKLWRHFATRTSILKLSGAPGIDSPSLCSLEARYDNPVPTLFLAFIDCSKIQAQQYKCYFYCRLYFSLF
jgi:hypothetical protein